MAKATKKQALGRGLSALLKDTSNNVKDNHDVVGNIIEVALRNYSGKSIPTKDLF